MELTSRLIQKPIMPFLIPAALMAALLAPLPCAAGTGLTVTLSHQAITVNTSGGNDQTFSFEATLTNTSATALYLNGDISSVDPPLTLDDSPFQGTFVFPTDPTGNPLPQPTLAGNSSLTVALFDVTVPAHTPFGTYGGSFDIQGGLTPNDFGLLAAPTFTVLAAPVPEASTFRACGIGLVLLGGCAFARRRRSDAV